MRATSSSSAASSEHPTTPILIHAWKRFTHGRIAEEAPRDLGGPGAGLDRRDHAGNRQPGAFLDHLPARSDNQYRAGGSYARPHNPTFAQPEALLAALEGGAACLTLASGMAAATAVFHGAEAGRPCGGAGGDVLGPAQVAANLGDGMGLEVTFAGNGNDAIAAAVRPDAPN